MNIPPDVISAVLKSQYYYNLLNGNNVTYDIKYALAGALNKDSPSSDHHRCMHRYVCLPMDSVHKDRAQ